MTKIDQLALTSADPQRISDATYSIINALQNYTPEERALASACHLKLTTEIQGLSPQDIMSPADRLMASPEGQYRRNEFRAARDYMRHE